MDIVLKNNGCIESQSRHFGILNGVMNGVEKKVDLLSNHNSFSCLSLQELEQKGGFKI